MTFQVGDKVRIVSYGSNYGVDLKAVGMTGVVVPSNGSRYIKVKIGDSFVHILCKESELELVEEAVDDTDTNAWQYPQTDPKNSWLGGTLE